MSHSALICTVKNERTTIDALLVSIQAQTRQPDEICISDGGSTDGTWERLCAWKDTVSGTARITLLQVPGNRSLGRNAAIKATQSPLVAITDAGCVLDPSWLERLEDCMEDTGARVIAGYAVPEPSSSDFAQAAALFFLVPESRVDPHTFLPATRSMLMQRAVWQAAGQFDPAATLNEDYLFARTIKNRGVKIAFCKEAIVYWIPPTSWGGVWLTAFRFACGDAQYRLRPLKGLSVALRYLGGLVVLVLGGALSALIALTLYSLWALRKHPELTRGRRFVPALQLIMDSAVIWGSLVGWIERVTPASRLDR